MSSTATRIKDAIAQRSSATPPTWHWYDGVAFYVIVQVITFSLSGLTSVLSGNRGKDFRETVFGNPSYFRSLRQSVFAPPAWVFGPAWTLNNILVIWGNLQVLNKPRDTEGRTTYLALQSASWLIYVMFNAAYFSLRSPINAFVLTIGMFLLTIASGFVAIFKLKDSKVALSLLTLFVWLIIAATAASFQVAWNRDDLYNAGPFFRVNPSLEKEPS